MKRASVVLSLGFGLASFQPTGSAVEAETGGTSLVVIPAQAGIQVFASGFRVAAFGLARNDGVP